MAPLFYSIECPVCQYPSRGDASIWRRLLFKETATEDVPVDMDHFLVSPSLRLTIQAAVPSDAGVYMCQNFYTVHAVYNIDVVGMSNVHTVRDGSAAYRRFGILLISFL